MSKKLKQEEFKNLIFKLIKEETEELKREKIMEQASSDGSLIKKTIYFGFNYPHDFIERVFGEGDSITNHLKSKFKNIYEKHGAVAFFRFYIELDNENQKLMDDFITNEYRG